jgi:hypothetical protein
VARYLHFWSSKISINDTVSWRRAWFSYIHLLTLVFQSDIELLGRELHAPILFWFGDVGRHGSSSASCRRDRAFGTLPGVMISQVGDGWCGIIKRDSLRVQYTGGWPISDRPLSQRPEQSPKSTIEKAKTLIDSIHEFKRDSPMSKSIAIGMDKLDMRVHVIGGMVIFQRGSV